MGIKRKIMDRFFQKEISKEIYNAKSEVYAKVVIFHVHFRI